MAITPFTPQALRGALVIVLILVIAWGAGIFYLGLTALHDYAIEVNHSITDAEASDKQVQSLQVLKGQLAQSQSLIAKANQMFSTPDTYQNQAVTDIRNYANAAGLTITKTNFDTYQPGTNPTVTIGLKSPLSYTRLIQFLDGIEGNIPKMQVTNIGINHLNGGGNDSISVDDIKIMIATKG